MNGFLAKPLCAALILTGWAGVALAQTTDPMAMPPPDRAASFLPAGSMASAEPAFSGLATEPPQPISPQILPPDVVTTPIAPPPVAAPVVVSAPTPSAPAVVVPPPVPPPTQPQPAVPRPVPVNVTPLPAVSTESIGLPAASGVPSAALGTGMWKATPRATADYLLSTTAVTTSPVLNGLMKRLLMTAAVPPDGTSVAPQSLTAMRAEKLVAFGALAEAWALVQQADPKLIDDVTFHFVAEATLLSPSQDPCPQAADFAKNHSSADWQKFTIICQFRAKDTKAAQVALDVLRTQPNRDTAFLGIADKNLLTTAKNLPYQLTPLTTSILALLMQTGLPLPGELYAHPDFALAPALLRAPAQQDLAQLTLAERAMERGIIGAGELAAVYRTVSFPPDSLAAPLVTSETGLRLHALLFQAAANEKDPGKRIAYAVKFAQTSPPAFLNNAGAVLGLMLGDIKPDATMAENAVILAQIYTLMDHGDIAMQWLKLAPRTQANADLSQALWPQFVLAGLEPDAAYAADLSRWMDSALQTADPQADMRAAKETLGDLLMLLDAAGFAVPDTAWPRVMTSSRNEKRMALSPIFLDRLQAAAIEGRKAETLLLATALAGDGDISLPEAVAITRALRQIGLKSEAATFARQMVALLGQKAG